MLAKTVDSDETAKLFIILFVALLQNPVWKLCFFFREFRSGIVRFWLLGVQRDNHMAGVKFPSLANYL